MSRADQSLNKHKPNIKSSASDVEIESPKVLPSKVIKAISSSKSTCLDGAKIGSAFGSGLICPLGL
jgi:hypothetical protein